MGDKDNYAGIKYSIIARFSIEGVVERHDVIGAIFGQTEGLFPKEFELRELQRVGKIGRIDIELKSANDKTTGTLVVPSSLDKPETAIIAAAIEIVDRVGPCDAKITIEELKDVREEKLRRIRERAKELLRDWKVRDNQNIESLISHVSREERTVEPIHYGRERLTATPDINQRNDIIVVEGRADVINLLNAGVSGSIAVDGAKIPRTIRDLARKKEITAFLDGDRGGDLILREMLQVAKPKYVARAPAGDEVEELNADQIKAALAARVPVEQAQFIVQAPGYQAPAVEREAPEAEPEEAVVEEAPPAEPAPPKGPDLSEYAPIMNDLKGSLEAILVTDEGKNLSKFPVSELVERVKKSYSIKAAVFDGIITGRLLDAAAEKGIKTVIGERLAEGIRIPQGLVVKAFKDLA